MSADNAEMTFWDHLEELRGTLIRSLIALCVMMVVGLVFRNFLFEKIILLPAKSDFFIYRWFHLAHDIQIVNLEISGQFIVHLRASLMLSVVLSCPYLIWELWKFISPALYPEEKQGVGKAFLLSSSLFYLGVAVGYFILLPVCLAFFQGYTVSDNVANTFSLQSYMSMFGSMVLLIGIVFEFPILIMILSEMGVLDSEMLKKGRRYAIVAVLIVAAVITPADLGSMVIVSIPLYGLYELSILFCKNGENKQEATLTPELAGDEVGEEENTDD